VDEVSENPPAACREVIAAIRRLLSIQQAPILVAVDGGSGAGKSTLASLIENELDTALIPLDDFFSADIPDSQWDEFTVEERLKRVFDWNRLRDHAIAPLLDGKPASWQAFDFESGLRPDGTYGMQEDTIEREPADVILLEGAYSAGPELADLVDLAILVDVPDEERHARLKAREDKVFLEKWHARWDAVESYYLTQVRPKSHFDLVVRTK
jgi:uridine kinase